MATTSRLLTLLSLLQERRDWPGSVLASRLDVSDRTVRRDIDRLREMGYRIETTMGPDGGYRLDAGAEMPPLLFDDDQALAVAIALRAAPALGAGIGEAAVRALATMRQVLPSRLRHRLDSVEVTTVGRPGEAPVAAVPLEVLLTLAQAVHDRVTLRFDYLSRGGGEAQPRRIEPHHLVASDGRWYLLGWDHEREDWRLFSADRVRPRVPHGAPFVPRVVPGGDVDAFVSARFKGANTNGWPCRGTVLLHAPVRDVLPFAGDGTVTAVDDERCTLEVGSWSWGALAASFGRFEVAMEVIGPPELAEAFAVQAERFARTAFVASTNGSGEPQE
ncbi:YafY family protein [Microbacterium sp. SORGH_AS_0421]|uniref:helix-turn-helix transcriptional regulator n=1 Tax=Microbacterium sp. SORGH_AS_0421 TaxID=3041768 RepID=UPI002790E9B8|nr:WYL domain-containing protein [Microbacterium sp. SORGH_AS_0421]MDQ1176214.1 putative DNA-binding transcriptional regulator YafY [Microbacterium sp. SORGH_AS_0421]